MNISYDQQFISAFKHTLDIAFSCPCHSMSVPFVFAWGTVLVSTTLKQTSEQLSEEISRVFADSKAGYVIAPVLVDGMKATSKMTARIYVVEEERDGPFQTAIGQIAKAVKDVCNLYNFRWNKQAFPCDGHALSSHGISGTVLMMAVPEKKALAEKTATDDPLHVQQIYTSV